MNTVTNAKKIEYWLDSLGCLQPCPICGIANGRAIHYNVAHQECWQANIHKHAEMCQLFDKAWKERRNDG